MGTSAEDVFDLFLSLNEDYRLTAVYNSSGSSALNTYLEPWLLFSIDMFDVCDQSLEYSTATQSFDLVLSQKNKNMLAEIMILFWLQKTVQDVLQMNNFIQDRDFKIHSNAQNLREKQQLYNNKRSEISQKLMNYKLRDADMWDAWFNQDFSAY